MYMVIPQECDKGEKYPAIMKRDHTAASNTARLSGSWLNTCCSRIKSMRSISELG